MEDDNDWAGAEGDGEEWECVVCNKSFRSEAAWNSHERSRKHLKEVERFDRFHPIADTVYDLPRRLYRLRAHMQEEEEELQLDAEIQGEQLTGKGSPKDDRVEKANADDTVTLPPESESEGDKSSLSDGIGDDTLNIPPRGEPRVDDFDAGKKQGTSLDPEPSARLQSTSDAQTGRKSSQL